MAQITLNSTGVASSGSLVLQSNGTTSALTIDTSQNVGLGVTPSASSVKTFEIGAVGLGLTNRASGKISLLQNAYYNAGFKYASSGMSTAMYEVDNGAHYWYNAASGTAGNAITFTQAMTLDASGNLGIGTSSPSQKLHVVQTTDANTDGIRVARSGTPAQYGVLANYGGATWLTAVDTAAGGNNVLVFNRSNNGSTFTESARIASGGQFCVNTTNTNGAFNVSGNVYLFSQSSGAGNSTLKWNSGTGQVTYDTSSRLVKDNIVDSPYGLAEVMQLKSRKYFRTDDQREEIGLVADEVQTVLPEFVPMSPKSIFTGDEADTELVPSGVYYEKLSSVLIKAIQEQQAIIEQLQADVAALKG